MRKNLQVISPLLTIITVVYNSALPLEKTIKTVLELKYPNVNYIIIDGGSNDGTVDIIKKYQDKIFYWITEKDKGIYDAMNKGWAKADENSYILYLGAGDYIISLPDMIKHAQQDIIYGNVNIGDKYLFDTKVDFRMKCINAVHHQALLIKKTTHPSPPFSLEFPVFADFDFNQRLYKAEFHFKKDASFYAYAMSGGVSSPHNRKEMLEVVNSNYGRIYVILARAYYFLQNIKNRLLKFSP